MTIADLGSALPIYVESTVGPAESAQFRTAGPNASIFATRSGTALAAVAGFCFALSTGAVASWHPFLAVAGATTAALLASIVAQHVLRRRHRRSQQDADMLLGAAITTHRVVCMAAAPGAAPTVTVDRPRSDLREVRVGTAAVRWYLAPVVVLRLSFCDGASVELLGPPGGASGAESALRLAGIEVLDLDGEPRPRPDFGPAGFVPTTPRRGSTPSQARARLLSCGLLGLVAGVSVFAGISLGGWLAPPADSRVTAQVAHQECTPAVVRQISPGDEMRSVHFEAATDFGRGTLVVGSARVDGTLGTREVDFTCELGDGGVRVAFSD